MTGEPQTNGRADARRLRALHPILDGDGGCGLVYDLERTFVLEVPPEFQVSIASGLSTGVFDRPLIRWLTETDLLTDQEPRSWAEGKTPALPAITDISFDMSGACNMGCAYCFEDAIASRIGPMSDETAVASLDFVFSRTAAAPHIALHFGSGEPLIRFDLLKRIVGEANARAAVLGKTIAYDLTTNATLVTEESICADMLAELRQGGVPIDYQPLTKVVRRLMIPQPITRFCGVAGS
jgi:uncharacterized protein